MEISRVNFSKRVNGIFWPYRSAWWKTPLEADGQTCHSFGNLLREFQTSLHGLKSCHRLEIFFLSRRVTFLVKENRGAEKMSRICTIVILKYCFPLTPFQNIIYYRQERIYTEFINRIWNIILTIKIHNANKNIGWKIT